MKKQSDAISLLAKQTFNEAWKYLDKRRLNKTDTIRLLQLVHASHYLWQQAPAYQPRNEAISLWQISRAYATIGEGRLSLQYAEQNIKVCKDHALDAFYLAYAYEAKARACVLLDQKDKATSALTAAQKAIARTAEKELEAFHRDISAIRHSLSTL